MTSNNKQAILVVSFGTSYAETRAKTIDKIEQTIAEMFPAFSIRRAFTSQCVINILKDRDKLEIDTVSSGLQKLHQEGFRTVVVQPTHVINGEEYEKLVAFTEEYRDLFDRLIIGDPLLTSTDDYIQVVSAIMEQFPDLVEDEALVLMGHGTTHYTNASYAALDYMFKEQGYKRVFVGTVEAYPAIDVILRHVKNSVVKKVILAPLMVVAGDHAINDMAGDEDDSWKSIFLEEGYQVTCVLKGIAEYEGIRQLYLAHVKEAIAKL